MSMVDQPSLTQNPDVCRSRRRRSPIAVAAMLCSLSLLPTNSNLSAQDLVTVDAPEALKTLREARTETHSESEYRAAIKSLEPLLARLDHTLAQEGDDALSPGERLDIELVRAQTKRRLFEMRDLRLHELVPVRYLNLSATNGLFTRPCAQPDSAVQKAVDELEALPVVLDNARNNLKRPARIWTDNAIATSRYATLMLTELIDSVCVDSAVLKQKLHSASEGAADSVASFRDWLSTSLAPRSTRSPTWTPEEIEVYQFEHEFLTGFSVDEMLRIAEEDEHATRQAMKTLAKRIHPSGDLAVVWELMKDETPPWSEIEAMAARYVRLAADWLKHEGADLVEIPERFDYGVEITAPMSRRVLSFGGASYGPTMGGRISGYYVLTPLEPWLSAAERASRLRSYNPYWTHVISYHEWLGHNVQRAVAHEFAEGTVKRQFSSIYLSQAWSFYLEKLLEDEGYYDTLPHAEALKTSMARLQMRMWRVQRILTKLRMAKGSMTFDQAVEAYITEIGMEPTNAYIEVQRDSQSPSPPGREIIGERIILGMRDEYQRRMGEHATLKGFHEALLRYGNLPLPMVRQLMFGDL